jgi:hypothetical protein
MHTPIMEVRDSQVKQQLRRIALSGIQHLNTHERSGDIETRTIIELYYNE